VTEANLFLLTFIVVTSTVLATINVNRIKFVSSYCNILFSALTRLAGQPRRSNLPGRVRAGLSVSGRFVAMRTFTSETYIYSYILHLACKKLGVGLLVVTI